MAPLGPCYKTGRLDPFRQHPETFSLSPRQGTTPRFKQEETDRLSCTSLKASSPGSELMLTSIGSNRFPLSNFKLF